MSLAVTPPSEPAGAGKPLSRRLAIAAFVASSLATAALTVGGGYATQALEARHADRKADYDRFLGLTGKMDKSAAGFVTTYLLTAPVDADGKPRKPLPLNDLALVAQKAAIEANIQEQDTVLEEVSIGFDVRDAIVIKQYRDQLGAIYDALEHLVPAQDGQVLMQAISNAQDPRAAVIVLLKDRARRFL